MEDISIFQLSKNKTNRRLFQRDEDKKDIKPLQIYNFWFESYAKGINPHIDEIDTRSPRQKTFSNAKLSLVYTPYLYIVIINCGLLIWKYLIQRNSSR